MCVYTHITITWIWISNNNYWIFFTLGKCIYIYKPYQIKKLILLIRKVQNNTVKLFQLVNFDSNQLQHSTCNLPIIYYCLSVKWPFFHLPIWEFIFITWATNIRLCLVYGAEICVLQAVPLWRSLLLLSSQTGLGPPTLEESMGHLSM